ncbi:hypothetical protein IQ13_2789 [Lacibacter cauensis]|uniref:Cupin domain-containing protein n=1 Tax=Lacibacter cauensis TaxID=510947 RepID=A0A562SH71_9BACT|nr:cupin domain-containing protein [Lacibacter cauensis]TWI80120.1 hypothetical protein IQ13_2789 [Lacibacter cauensis]
MWVWVRGKYETRLAIAAGFSFFYAIVRRSVVNPSTGTMKKAEGAQMFKWKWLLILFFVVIIKADSYTQELSINKLGVVWQDSLQWNSFAAFPAKVKLAILVGDPRKPAPYLVRVKVPLNEKIMPHKHPEDRVYTVISGVFYIGIGEVFNDNILQAYPPGAVIVLPGNTPHFHWAKSGEYITQVYAIGPLGLEYIDTKYDPRLTSTEKHDD